MVSMVGLVTNPNDNNRQKQKEGILHTNIVGAKIW